MVSGIETMLLYQVAAIGDDGVGILHHLQPLEVIVVVQPHAGADDLKKFMMRNGQSRSWAHNSR